VSNLASRRTTGPLNERQRRILDWFYQGYQQEWIAEEMELSRQTVAEHMRVIILKLGVRNSWHACAKWSAYVAHLKTARDLAAAAALETDPRTREVLTELAARERRIADRLVEPMP